MAAKRFLKQECLGSSDPDCPFLWIKLGMHLPSRANESREHWTKQTKKAALQKSIGKNVVSHALLLCPIGLKRELTVTLTRCAPRMLDDDNNVSAFKSIRDGVAEALGVKDGPKDPVFWKYAQRTCKAYGILIEVRG